MKTSKKKQSPRESSIRQDIRHLGVLIERVDDNVKLVAEQYGNVKKDTNSIKKTLDSHTGMLDSHTEMIGKIMVNSAITKEDIEFIKNSLKKKIDIEEFAALERRVALLERRR